MKKLAQASLALALAATAAFGLAGCGSSGDNAPSGSDSGSSQPADGGDEAPAGESEAFVQDLQDGVDMINDKIAEEAGMTQIMLASDVDQPTQKYGMWVLPYYPSDAVEKFTKQIQIDGGTKFVVTAVSAETGKTWTMDQDGNMTEAGE